MGGTVELTVLDSSSPKFEGEWGRRRTRPRGVRAGRYRVVSRSGSPNRSGALFEMGG